MVQQGGRSGLGNPPDSLIDSLPTHYAAHRGATEISLKEIGGAQSLHILGQKSNKV